MNCRSVVVLALSVGIALSGALAEEESKKALIRDIATVEGVRDNPLVGYGIVVGLKGTGDSRQTIFTVQTLANVLQRMGVQIPPGTARVNNVAAVFVTTSLPPFARPGMQLDITVSSLGDAKSLEGGLLLLTPLSAADGQVYAAAQGPLTIGGYSAGNSGNLRQVNHPTVGRIAGGGLVERPAPVELHTFPKLALLLREASFGTASEIAASINQDFGRSVAVAADNRRIEIDLTAAKAANLAELMAHIEGLGVTVHRRAKVVVNERTGHDRDGKGCAAGRSFNPAREFFGSDRYPVCGIAAGAFLEGTDGGCAPAGRARRGDAGQAGRAGRRRERRATGQWSAGHRGERTRCHCDSSGSKSCRRARGRSGGDLDELHIS